MSPAIASRNRVEAPVSESYGEAPRSESLNSWLPTLEWCAVVGLILIFVGQTLVPAWQTLRSEFPDYYLAAELYHHNIPIDRIYEWTWLQRQNDHLGVREGLVSFAPNPPTSIFPLLALTALQPLAAKRVWVILSVCFLALSLALLRRATALGWRRLLLIAFLCLLPLREDFLFGRPYVFVLLLVCIAYFAAVRNHRWESGVAWSAAAAMKLFPALSLILFLRRKDWRTVAGFLLGAATLASASLFVFGLEVHRVFFNEVLSQASRGDWLGPYALSQNSFITLWSHLFLLEPELNPSPWINSPTLYAVALATTTTVVVLAFLWSVKREETQRANALHWASIVPMFLLLSTSTAPDHSCLLIFTAIVGFDALLAMGKNSSAFALLVLYAGVAAPIPGRVQPWFPLYRLLCTTALYGLLLYTSASGHKQASAKPWFAAGLVFATILTFYNLHLVRNRDEDFSRRLTTGSVAFRLANPVPVAEGVAFTEMQPKRYQAAVLVNGVRHEIDAPGDILAVTGSKIAPFLYAELTGRKSFIVRLPLAGAGMETVAEGQEPTLSPNGKWLAFTRVAQDGASSVFLAATDSLGGAHEVLPSALHPIDVSVADDGDVIASVGNVSYPRLLIVKHNTGVITALPAFPHPARYPSISPDGTRLAFSHRIGGSWHLAVQPLAAGTEQRLTEASCNAIEPSWTDNRTLLYATDCGRGVGLSAIARVEVGP